MPFASAAGLKKNNLSFCGYRTDEMEMERYGSISRIMFGSS